MVVTYCCLEHALVAPVCLRRFFDFFLGGIGVDDAVLARNLFAVAALVQGFFVPVVFELLLETRFQLADLAVLDVVVAAARCVRLEELDLVLDARVQDLSLRDDRLERAAGRCVGALKRALVYLRDTADLLRQSADVCFCGFDAREKVLV